jgi:ABC-type transport system involved in cytochrome c biogenesis ATPase subunit
MGLNPDELGKECYVYIRRIILRKARNFDELDISLFDEWTEQPLQSLLLTGPNGTGKTTILRIIAALWENLGEWLRLRKALNSEQQGGRGVLRHVGLAAIEIRDLLDDPVWLFTASTQAHWDELRSLAKDINPNAQFFGELRGARGRPVLEPRELPAWFSKLQVQKERLTLGVDHAEKLPNLVFLEADTRTILTPLTQNPDVYTEALYQWLVTYEARERWTGHIEAMLRNLKIRDPKLFSQTVLQISNFFEGEKRITDFDDNLRLQVQMGRYKRDSHPIDDLSAGEKQCLIQMFMVSRWLMDGGIVLIDEPDLHLHVSLQRQFIHELERVVLAKGGQLIVTSHSPTLWEEYHARQRIELGELVYG